MRHMLERQWWQQDRVAKMQWTNHWTRSVGTSNFTNQVKSIKLCTVAFNLKKMYSSGSYHVSIVCKYFISISTFQSRFSFPNDSRISQSRSGRIVITCQQGALISQGDKCGRKHVNLSQEFFNLSSFPNMFSLNACKPPYHSVLSFSCPSKQCSPEFSWS